MVRTYKRKYSYTWLLYLPRDKREKNTAKINSVIQWKWVAPQCQNTDKFIVNIKTTEMRIDAICLSWSSLIYGLKNQSMEPCSFQHHWVRSGSEGLKRHLSNVTIRCLLALICSGSRMPNIGVEQEGEDRKAWGSNLPFLVLKNKSWDVA